jgi:hypothetical protein
MICGGAVLVGGGTGRNMAGTMGTDVTQIGAEERHGVASWGKMPRGLIGGSA